jgi:hypothetical protein
MKKGQERVSESSYYRTARSKLDNGTKDSFMELQRMRSKILAPIGVSTKIIEEKAMELSIGQLVKSTSVSIITMQCMVMESTSTQMAMSIMENTSTIRKKDTAITRETTTMYMTVNGRTVEEKALGYSRKPLPGLSCNRFGKMTSK